MKLRLTLLAILSIILISAKGGKQSTITIINKSGMSVSVSILSNDLSKNYYFTLPEGDRQQPYVTKVTIEQDDYRLRVYWPEERDPTTYLPCRSSRSVRLIAERNIRVVITECDRRPIPRGEPGMYKFGTESCMY